MPTSFLQTAAIVRSRRSLYQLLVTPFILQIVMAFVAVGYVAIENGKETIHDLANQLMDEVSVRITENLTMLLTLPKQLNQANAAAIQQKILNVNDGEGCLQYFRAQLLIFDRVTSFAIAQGDRPQILGVEQREDGLVELRADATTRGEFHTYHLNEQGQRVRRIDIQDEPRWYQMVLQANPNGWGLIRPHLNSSVLHLYNTQPIYNAQRQRQALLLTTLSLAKVNQFLSSLTIGKTGQAFIIERDGSLVATSIATAPFKPNNQRRKAMESQDPLTRQTSLFLLNQMGWLATIRTPQKLITDLNGQTNFVRVIPFNDVKGLDWLVVVIVPENDFMERVMANTLSTFWVSVGALTVTTGVSILIARWITQPISQLNQSARAIAQGNWQTRVDVQRSDELGELAKSFNYMAEQLEESFTTLESKVVQRTEALNRANRELAKLAIIDELTQVANRRYLDRYLEQEWQRCHREQLPLSLILCDVDYFKRYNDLYGHPQGDQCLIQIAQTMTQMVKRPADLVARYGGEEFAIILPNTSAAGAVLLAERVGQAIRQLQIPHADSDIQPIVTLSLGVSCIVPISQLAVQDLVAAADHALYEAKHQGRDRYSVSLL